MNFGRAGIGSCLSTGTNGGPSSSDSTACARASASYCSFCLVSLWLAHIVRNEGLALRRKTS